MSPVNNELRWSPEIWISWDDSRATSCQITLKFGQWKLLRGMRIVLQSKFSIGDHARIGRNDEVHLGQWVWCLVFAPRLEISHQGTYCRVYAVVTRTCNIWLDTLCQLIYLSRRRTYHFYTLSEWHGKYEGEEEILRVHIWLCLRRRDRHRDSRWTVHLSLNFIFFHDVVCRKPRIYKL